jgi:hypothetical protein
MTMNHGGHKAAAGTICGRANYRQWACAIGAREIWSIDDENLVAGRRFARDGGNGRGGTRRGAGEPRAKPDSG